MLLIGMKSVLRDHVHQSGVPGTTRGMDTTTSIGTIVSEQRARRLAEALGAEGYLECSAKLDMDSVHQLFKALAFISLSYTARVNSGQPQALARGHHRRGKFARKRSFIMSIIYNSGRTTNSTIGTTWSFWRDKRLLNRVQQRL